MNPLWLAASIVPGQARAFMVDEQGRWRWQHRCISASTPPLRLLQEALEGLLASCDVQPQGISIGAPGLIDAERGIVLDCPALHWSNLPLADFLRSHFNLPACVDNQAALLARALHHAQPQRALAVLHWDAGGLQLGQALGDQYQHSHELLHWLKLDEDEEEGDQRAAQLGEITLWVCGLLRPSTLYLSRWPHDPASLTLERMAEQLQQMGVPCPLALIDAEEEAPCGASLHALARIH